LFIPCLVEQFHPEVGIATAKVLTRAGVEVYYPKGQTCCGQPVYKSGLRKKTIPIAKHFIRLFESAEAIVAPSGSCVSMVRNEFPVLFDNDPGWKQRAVELGARVYELTEFLVKALQIDDLGAHWPGRAVYHDSCQVMRALGVCEEPRKLLAHVKELELVEMDRPDLCCGFGGPFSYVLVSKAEYLIGAEISCLMNMGGYLQKHGYPVKAVHIAEVLANRKKRKGCLAP
ncbi:MAG: (Fe-S)-binding protein, partial [Deltaproteobacteria bacterium]|nr:(Fe-S)-binding protein [Deltaproteobacteria bacterium]